MCGIFGLAGDDSSANYTYLGLYALQHRGQESSGLVSWDGTRMHVERGMGEVADIFGPNVLARLRGSAAIGHTRYSTAGKSVVSDAQPIVVNTAMGPLAIVHNGNLVNAGELRSNLERDGSIFQTTSDTEVILHLMARNPRDRVVDSLVEALAQVQGAYSLLLLTTDGLIAARDPHGVRPLVIGRMASDPQAVCFSSESCAFDLLEAEMDGELEPGEVMVVRDGHSERLRFCSAAPKASRCAFEHVYFARPDSRIFGDPVSVVRTAMGETLARESPAEAELVVPVPDSGLFSAIGFSRESGLPFEFGLIRNHYVGRTFIEPKQSIRDFGARIKLNPVKELIAGRSVVLVDDSIVRGTTSRKIVRMVREAGAARVHLRISSPPTSWPCHYGIDTPRRQELIAAQMSCDEICQYIEADSLAYLSVEGLMECLGSSSESYCAACWTGSYPIPVGAGAVTQRELFPISAEGES